MKDKDRSTPPQNFALMAACFEGSLAVVAVALGWLLGRAPLETLNWAWSDVAWGMAAVLPPLGLLWLCVKSPWRPLAEIIRVIDEILVPLFQNCGPVEFAMIAALAGLGEELLFRGVIQTTVAAWVDGDFGVWVGLATAGVLFGLAHAVTFTYVLLAGLIGLYLGGIWLATGNLLVPMIAHTGYDFVALWYLVKIRKRQASQAPA